MIAETKNSTHTAEVFRVDQVFPHENADRLEVVKYECYTTCVRKGDFQSGDLAVFIHPDTMVPLEQECFAFLKSEKRPDETHARIKAKKLRGIRSFGLLIPAPEGFSIGDDVFEHLGLVHYDPDEHKLTLQDDCVPAPFHIPKYDLEPLLKYGNRCFEPGECVSASEKTHGANARYVFHDGQMYCGSRSQWKEECDTNIWWKALRNTPALERFCCMFPDTVVFGEVYGQVQDLKYGHGPGEVSFAAFDIYKDGAFLDFDEAYTLAKCWGIPWVPIVYRGPFDMDILSELAEGESLIPGANHVREGIVVTPVKERWHERCGRVKLKLVGCGYLERA